MKLQEGVVQEERRGRAKRRRLDLFQTTFRNLGKFVRSQKKGQKEGDKMRESHASK